MQAMLAGGFPFSQLRLDKPFPLTIKHVCICTFTINIVKSDYKEPACEELPR